MKVAMLATLAAILERGSFSAAAAQVGCTPGAVSLQVKQLESYFGQPLFDRSARTVRPAPLAFEVAAAARDFTARLQSLRASRSSAVGGRVRLGAITSVQTDALPQALQTLQQRHPALQVGILLADSDDLLAELKAGRIDAAAVVRPPSGGSSRLAWSDLARQPYVMLLPPGATGASAADLLQRHELIRYDPALTGGRIAARYLSQLCPGIRPRMELRSIDAIVAMVSAGLGVAVVPRPRQALLDAHGVRTLGLGRRAPVRQIALARRAADAEDRSLDAVAQALAAAYAARKIGPAPD